METVLRGAQRTVVIGPDRPTVLIGERINPTGKKGLVAALAKGDLEIVRGEAVRQVEGGADVLDVNVGTAEVDEVALLPEAVRLVMETVDVPVSIDSGNVEALRAALRVHRELAPEGKALINSVNGEEARLESVLPLVAEYGASVIGLAMDDDGIPPTAERRLAVASKIVERAEAAGVSRADVVIDCLSLTVGAEPGAGLVTLEAIRMVRRQLGVNMTLGASNVSFGMPDREVINRAFLALVIQAGVNCPIVDAEKVRPTVLAVDLLLGRDEYAMRYIKAYKTRTR